MQTYIVGGAVRDALLGLPVNDRDWVVVGATPQQLIAAGFLPVGKDFPVFLHPETREEYALARTERKTAAGYHGFVFHAEPNVTLEQDLARRDLTINAMAQNPVFEILAAVERIDDAPVEILRLARFAARFSDFSVAPETMHLMREMVEAGEVDALVAERVWQEIARGLMEAKPSRMFEILRECGALARLLPEVDRLWGVPQRADYHPEVDTGVHLMMVMDMSARLDAPLAVRFACLMHDLGKGTTPADVLPRHIGHEMRSVDLLRDVCDRLRVPGECRELADVVAREHSNIHKCTTFGAAAIVRLLERADAFRKPQRFENVLLACECDARGRLGKEDEPYEPRPLLLASLAAAQSVPTHEIAAAAQARGVSGPKIGEMIHHARADAVGRAL
jgi:tRNA nucleotidyltransferase (CCA-adding enzyme)